jgi:hypothetical protein
MLRCLLVSWLGCARPEPAELVLTARWEGASTSEVEARVGLPLEEALAELPGAADLRVHSHPGHVRIYVSLPSASAQQLSSALDAAALPGGVVPSVQVDFAHVSDWLLPVPQARELLPALNAEFGLDSAWSDTLPVDVIEVYLPQRADLVELRASLAPGLTRTEALERLAPRATAVRPAASRVSAAYNGEPIALVHVGRPADEVERWLRSRGVAPVAVPSERAVHLAAWGSPPDTLMSWLREAGAQDLLVIAGRPPPGGAPEPGRLEIVARWPQGVAVPALDLPGVQISPLPATRSVVTGPEEVLRAAGPPPLTTWEVEIDAERARQLGVSPHEIAEAVRLATSGYPLLTSDGAVIELRLGEGAQARDLEAISGLLVDSAQGERVAVRDVARLVSIEEPRERVRADRQPAAVTTGALPEGAHLLSREPLLRYPW